MSHIQRHRQTEEKLQGIARMVEAELPDGTLFALICFNGGDRGGYSSYVSNANRQDMARAMYEAADRMATKTDSDAFADIEELESRKNRAQRRRDASRKKRRGQ